MILRALALCLAMVAPASATEDGWPALFDVTGVAENDVLNIRATPGTGGEVIGTLTPDAKDIEVIQDDRTGWGQINTGEVTGWVSLDFMARQPGQWRGQFPDQAQCFGTEPFWSASLTADGAVFESPESLPLDFAETSELRSRNRIDRHTRVYENAVGGMVATLGRALCSDGMSDRIYGWDINLLLVVAGDGNAQMFSGCCSIAP